jgi:hypothetical protein
VRTDQIGKPEQRRECGEVAYDQRKLVIFHHCCRLRRDNTVRQRPFPSPMAALHPSVEPKVPTFVVPPHGHRRRHPSAAWATLSATRSVHHHLIRRDHQSARNLRRFALRRPAPAGSRCPEGPARHPITVTGPAAAPLPPACLALWWWGPRGRKNTMPFRTVVLIAASVILGIACTATEVFARVPVGTTRLRHHQGTVHHTGHVRHPQTPAKPLATTGVSPYCWPYDYSYDPAHYCGASYIVSW